jgi:hypothetical protein
MLSKIKCQKVLFNLIFKEMENIASNKKIRVLDILDNIEQLNTLINLHKKETRSSLMVKQYQNMREQFLAELKTILFDFQLNVEVLKAA